MRVALVSVYSHQACTLKDVAGGFGTVFQIGDSLPAKLLEWAKGRVARLDSPSLATVAAFLRAGGHEVVPVDLVRTDRRQDPLPEVDVALVLSSIVDAPAELAVLSEFRDRGVRALAFGAYATACPEAYLEVAAAVIVGEPEALGSGIVDPSLSGRVDAGYVSDLDALPWPDWGPFDYRKHRYAFLPRPILPVSAARGCAFGCDYCPWRVTAPFRERDPQRVIAEVAHLRARYGAKSIAFRDPLFNLSSERVIELGRGLRPLGMRFSAEMRADRVEPGSLKQLHHAGLRSMEIGVESIDREMLKRSDRKPPEFEQIEEVVRTAHSVGIRVVCNFMFGLPDDHDANIEASIAYAKKLTPFAVQFTVATPYPGTGLEKQVRDRRLTLAPEHHTGWQPTYEHTSLSPERLERLRESAYIGYHYRPRYAYRFARHTLDAVLAR